MTDPVGEVDLTRVVLADANVLAAAWPPRRVLCTSNVKDFPVIALGPLGIEVLTPPTVEPARS